VFVCHGNIMRSAMAEALLRRHQAGRRAVAIEAISAGLHAVPGKPADPRAREMARALGVSLEGHEARRLTPDLVQRAGLLLVMDRLNEAELVSRFGAAEKTRLLGAFLPGEPEIADPYLGSEAQVEQCFLLLDRAVRALADRLPEARHEAER
jgi:protein-tyrosine phosphatase